MMEKNEKKPLKRSEEITKDYFTFLDKHIDDVINQRVLDFLELNQIANALHISHSHLSDTLQQTTGHHPCHFYDSKIINQAKLMLSTTEMSVAKVAEILTYNPSNFSKFFKKWTEMTPGEFKKKQKKF